MYYTFIIKYIYTVFVFFFFFFTNIVNNIIRFFWGPLYNLNLL